MTAINFLCQQIPGLSGVSPDKLNEFLSGEDWLKLMEDFADHEAAELQEYKLITKPIDIVEKPVENSL